MVMPGESTGVPELTELHAYGRGTGPVPSRKAARWAFAQLEAHEAERLADADRGEDNGFRDLVAGYFAQVAAIEQLPDAVAEHPGHAYAQHHSGMLSVTALRALILEQLQLPELAAPRTHAYLSTACYHAIVDGRPELHRECRVACKFGEQLEPCRCPVPGCHAPEHIDGEFVRRDGTVVDGWPDGKPIGPT